MVNAEAGAAGADFEWDPFADETLGSAPDPDPEARIAAREAVDRLTPHERLLILLRFEGGEATGKSSVSRPRSVERARESHDAAVERGEAEPAGAPRISRRRLASPKPRSAAQMSCGTGRRKG